MDYTLESFATVYIQTSGSGVIGISGKPVYLGGFMNGNASSQGIQLYGASGGAVVTMAFATIAGGSFTRFPGAFASGLTYQTVGNPGDAAIRLTFFYLPGSGT